MSYRFQCDACGSTTPPYAAQGMRDDICEDCGYYPGMEQEYVEQAEKYETLTACVRVSKTLMEDAAHMPALREMIADDMKKAALRAFDTRFAPMLPDQRGEHDRSRTEGPDGGRSASPPEGDSASL